MATNDPAPFLRLFIAIAVAPEMRQEIGRTQGRLQRNSPPGAVRWTRPDQFHITLQFLGDVPTEQVAALETALAPIWPPFPTCGLSRMALDFSPAPTTRG